MRAAVPFALIGGEQADGGDIGRQIERVGGERALQRLPPVGGEGEHALGGVAVEFDIDAGQPDGAAHHIGLRLDREAAEAAAGQRPLAGPDQRLAQRGGVGGERAFDLERRLDADRAFERGLHAARRRARSFRPVRLPASAAGKSASVMLASTGSSCQTKRPVAPKLLEIDGQASEKSTSRQRLVDLAGLVAHHHGAVVDAHLGEGRDARCAGVLAARQRLDQAGPVGSGRWLQIDRDGRPLQRHVGDFDAADQQREKAQARGQPLGGERRPLGIAEHHVGEADAAGGKQRDRGLAAQDRIRGR